MLKKIVLGLILALTAIVALLQYQRAQLEQRVADFLHRQSIPFEQLKTQLFPSPSLILRQVSIPLSLHDDIQARSISAKFLQVDFAWLPLLIGKGKIEQLQLSHGQFGNWENLNFSLKPTALYVADLPELQAYWQEGIRDNDNQKWQYRFSFSAQDPQQKQVNMNAHIQLNPNRQIAVEQGEIKLRTDGEMTLRTHWQFKQAKINQFGNNWFQFTSQNNLVNKQNWGKLVGQLKLSPRQNEFLLQLDNKQQLQLNWHTNLSKISVRSQSFPIEKVFGAVGLPELFKGDAIMDLSLWQRTEKPWQGKFNLNIFNGELIGLNFAAIVRNYFPINYDESSLANANTRFEQLQMDWQRLDNQLQLKKLALHRSDIALSGSGVADLINRQCDFKLFITHTKVNEQALKLPVHLWGNCAALQYKVDFNRDLRNQLKDLIKRKWK